MRTLPPLAIAAVLSFCVVVPARAQSGGSNNRWLPRFGDIFSSKKSNEPEKKSKAPIPAPKPAAKTIEKAPAAQRTPASTEASESTVFTIEEKSTRLMEILVELALLGDPVTFPYLLEARVVGQTLQVRGTVSSKAVREHALKVVRVHCPLTVVDAMREHPGIAPKRTATDRQSLENSVKSALKQAFPKETAFEVNCSADGKTEVTGFVRSLEDKLRVSQTLRRLHGCTHVHNLVHVLVEEGVAAEPAKTPPITPASSIPTPVFRKSAPTPPSVPVAPANEPDLPPVPKIGALHPADVDLLPILERMSEQPMKMAKPLKDFPSRIANNAKPAEKKLDSDVKPVSAQIVDDKPAPFSTASPSSPVITVAAPMEIPLPELPPPIAPEKLLPPAITPEKPLPPPDVPLKKPDTAPQMLPGVPASLPNKLKTIVETACGQSLRDVHVEVLSATDIVVQFRVNDEADGRHMARRVLALPELQRYRVEVRVRVPQ